MVSHIYKDFEILPMIYTYNFFLIFFASEEQTSFAKCGKLNNLAHWIYFEECRPDERTKCPSKSALVFFKILKDFLCESITFL